MRTKLTLGLVLVGTATLAARGDWPQFRGPGGLATSADKGLPVRWGPTENIAWKTPLPGPGTSSPVVKGKRVFVTCYSGYGVPGASGTMEDLKLHVVCVGLDDGKILWDKTVAPRLPEFRFGGRNTHGYASGTPAADDGRVYAFFGRTGVVAFDHAGNQLWHTPVGDKVHEWGSGSSPVLYGDMVIVNAGVESGALVALDKTTGKEAWRVPGMRETWASPLVVELPGGKAEVVMSSQGRVMGIDPESGEVLWTCQGLRNYACPTPVAHAGVVYVVGDRFQPTALAIRAGGRGDVTNSHVLWRVNKGPVVPSPVYHDGHLYFAHDTLRIAYCLDARDGKVVYEERLRPESDILYPSPVLADGKLYYLSRDGRGFVLKAGPEYEVLAANERLERSAFNASPAVAGGRLLLRSDRHLYCITNEKN